MKGSGSTGSHNWIPFVELNGKGERTYNVSHCTPRKPISTLIMLALGVELNGHLESAGF